MHSLAFQSKMNKGIAEDALEQLSKLDMKSWNKPWNLHKKQRHQALDVQRAVGNRKRLWGDIPNQAQFIKDEADDLGYRVGNCWERATLFADFAAKDIRTHHFGLVVYRAEIVGRFDHVIAILTQKQQLSMNTQMSIKNDFEKAVVILDGWTEDWYFPNLDLQTAIRYGCWRAPNPFAAVVRAKTLWYGNIRLQTFA